MQPPQQTNNSSASSLFSQVTLLKQGSYYLDGATEVSENSPQENIP